MIGGSHMVRVLIVERDALLRECLELMLEEAGYTVAGTADSVMALYALQVSSHPLVVLLRHGGLEAPEMEILRQAPYLPKHAYLLLSSYPARAPLVRNPHTDCIVPVVPLPFGMDEVQCAVAEVASRLHPAPVGTGPCVRSRTAAHAEVAAIAG